MAIGTAILGKTAFVQAIVRAQADIAAGRLWKARDRLRGAFVTCPADPEVNRLLGEVLYEMGDLPEAARYWAMTDQADPRFEAAYSALQERHGGDPVAVASAIPVRAKLDELPPVAQQRLRALKASADAKAGRAVDLGWERKPNEKPPPVERRWLNRLGDAVGAVVALAFVAALVVGIGSLAFRGVEVFLSLFD